MRARVFTELAWHSLFIRNLLIRPERAELAGYVPEMTIIDLPTRWGELESADTLRIALTPSAAEPRRAEMIEL